MKETFPIYLAKIKFSLELFVIDWLRMLFKHNDMLLKEKNTIRGLLDTLSAFFNPGVQEWIPEPVHYDPLPLNYISLDAQQLSYTTNEKAITVKHTPRLRITGKIESALAGAFSFRLETHNYSEWERGEIATFSSTVNHVEKRFEFEFLHLPGPGSYYLYLFPLTAVEQSENRDIFGFYPEATRYLLTVQSTTTTKGGGC